MSPQQTSTLGSSPSMLRTDPDEQMVATVYRHPFGIVAIYVEVFFGLIAASGLLLFILPNFVNRDENPGTYAWLAVGLLIVAGVMVLILLIATIIYHRSKLIITSKSITQITQIGLFNRKISQLAISNIEDATAIRKGIFQTMLNYGTLNVETAGETENFYFSYCPDPDKYAKTVLEMREHFLSNREMERRESGASYANMQPQYAPQGYAPQPVMPQTQQQYPMQYATAPPQPQYPPQQPGFAPSQQQGNPYPPQQQPGVDLPTPETDYRAQP